MEASILLLDDYFPQKELKITEVINTDAILIRLKSVTKYCGCPRCHKKLEHYHGTYVRKVQDLPILGKSVQLQITANVMSCPTNGPFEP